MASKPSPSQGESEPPAAADDDFRWEGPLPAPDFTMVPNVVFDMILPHLDGGEAKVLFFLIRETYGWHSQAVQLSLPQVCAGAGVSRRTAAEALKSFEARGMVRVERTTGQHGKESNIYALLITEDRKYISYTSAGQKIADPGRIDSSLGGRIDSSRPTSSIKKEEREERGQPLLTERPGRYTGGRYGVCAECGMSPHDPSCSLAEMPARKERA
jgi:hypothetical protein